MKGMSAALTAMRKAATDGEPLTLYYAFKQSELADEGIVSPGWASFLQAVVDSGLAVDGTWPVRTELSNRMIAKDANALASSVVLVCRKRPENAPTATRADFLRALRREMLEAVEKIRKASVGPVDMPQSVIGPGMGVFTRNASVLEDDDSPMSAKTALALINRVWGEIEDDLDANFDPETTGRAGLVRDLWLRRADLGRPDQRRDREEHDDRGAVPLRRVREPARQGRADAARAIARGLVARHRQVAGNLEMRATHRSRIARRGRRR